MDGTKEDCKLSYVDPITFAQELDTLAKSIALETSTGDVLYMRNLRSARTGFGWRFWSRRRYACQRHGASARLPIASPRYAAPAKVRWRHWCQWRHKEVKKYYANFIQ